MRAVDLFAGPGSRTKQFEQVGNAVPPPLARAVIRALLASAAEERRAA